MLGYFTKTRKTGSQKYREFVSVGKGQPSPWDKLKNQIFLGSDEFVEDAQAKRRIDQPLKNIPRLQKLAPVKSLDYYLDLYDRNEGMVKAYLSGHYTLARLEKPMVSVMGR